MQNGLKATASLFQSIQQAYVWVHQAAHLLANAEQREVKSLKQAYEQLLETMKEQQEYLGNLAPAVTHFCKVTASYGERLFQCY